jgi:hypothetical protein
MTSLTGEPDLSGRASMATGSSTSIANPSGNERPGRATSAPTAWNTEAEPGSICSSWPVVVTVLKNRSKPH